MCPSEPETKDTNTVDPIAALRDEFAEQFAALKSSFEQLAAEKDETIKRLTDENDQLHRALVRSAMTESPSQPVKTEQEKYDEVIANLANKTLKYMESR